MSIEISLNCASNRKKINTILAAHNFFGLGSTSVQQSPPYPVKLAYAACNVITITMLYIFCYCK